MPEPKLLPEERLTAIRERAERAANRNGYVAQEDALALLGHIEALTAERDELKRASVGSYLQRQREWSTRTFAHVWKLENLRWKSVEQENERLRKALAYAAISLSHYDASYGGGGGEQEAFEIAQLLGYDGDLEIEEIRKWLLAESAKAPK